MSTRHLEVYLRELAESGKERTRWTRQLQTLVSEVLDEITKHVPEGMQVDVPGVGTLHALSIRATAGTWFTIVHREHPYAEDFCVFASRRWPGESFYLYNDLHVKLQNAPREVWLRMANRLPDIVQAFKIESDNIVTVLREALTKLRDIAETPTE